MGGPGGRGRASSIQGGTKALGCGARHFLGQASPPRPLTCCMTTTAHAGPPALVRRMQGLIPIVGAAREAGTSMLIEDVACPVDKLADMMIDLIDMFKRHGYDDASCFGHALEGNLHLVFSQVGACRCCSCWVEVGWGWGGSGVGRGKEGVRSLG